MVADEGVRAVAQSGTLEIIRAALARLLQRHATLNIAAILSAISHGSDEVITALESLVQDGRVELLRPIGLRTESAATHSTHDPVLDYYRWKRPTDTDHIWQAMLARGTHKRGLIHAPGARGIMADRAAQGSGMNRGVVPETPQYYTCRRPEYRQDIMERIQCPSTCIVKLRD